MKNNNNNNYKWKQKEKYIGAHFIKKISSKKKKRERVKWNDSKVTLYSKKNYTLGFGCEPFRRLL